MKTYPSNSLAFPGRAPGFDPSHPASSVIGLSVVASAGNGGFLSLAPGLKISGLAGTASVSSIGKVQTYAVSGTDEQGTLFTNSFSGTPTGFTAACIFVPSTNSANSSWLVNVNNTSNGIFINALRCGAQASNFDLNFSLSVGVPYFFAASLNSAVAHYVLVNLQTGQIFSATNTSGYTFAAFASPWAIGGSNFNFGNSGGNSSIAAAMISFNKLLSMQQMLAWAADPWSFWYPRINTSLIFESLKTPSTGGTSYSLSLESVSYSLVGTPDTFGIGMPMSSDSYSYAGINPGFGVGVSAETGTYNVTGDPAVFGIGMPLGSSGYTYAGTQASFNTKISLIPNTSSYVFNGGNPSLTYTQSGITTSVAHYLPWLTPVGRFRSF